MIDKEVAEIRRRFKSDRCAISRLRACYVNENKEIVSTADQSLGLLTEDEAEHILSILKKTLSGAVGVHLLNIDFSTDQVMHGEEHKLLMNLRETMLTDESVVNTFFNKIANSLEIEGSYMVLLAADTYDVLSFRKDGERSDDSSEIFRYLVCAICPIKSSKTTLSYKVKENCFCNLGGDTALGRPELGFMFPAFDNRATNLYGALYYTRSMENSHEELVDALFHTGKLPMPAAEQKSTFRGIIAESAGDACSLSVVSAVHSQIAQVVEDQKAHRDEPCVIDKYALRDILEASGVSDAGIETFEKKFESDFGAGAEVNPKNVMDVKKFEVRTPDVVIRVKPDRKDLIQTRVIDGTRYILIRADEGAELNGINIQIQEDKD